MIDVIIILGTLFIIRAVSKLLKRYKKKRVVSLSKLYAEPVGESFYYRRLYRDYAVKNLEVLVNMRKVSLALCLRLNQISYSEYGKLFDELMEWKRQQWEEIYKND